MQVATLDGKVVLFGTCLPKQWNGYDLTVYDLKPEQDRDFSNLPTNRQETHFDGTIFSAIGTVNGK